MVPAIRYTAVLMLVVMLLQASSVMLYYGLFFLNRNAISETVCEKKTMDCSGRCYLQKKIDAVQDPQPASTEGQTSAKTLEQLLNTFPGLLPQDQNFLLSSSASNMLGVYPDRFLSDGVMRPIDHPPNA